MDAEKDAEAPALDPVLDLLLSMTASSSEASGLDAKSQALVRIAALVSLDAPPDSYVLDLCAADIGGDEVRGVLAAIAPIVGTARIASATDKIAGGLGMAIDEVAVRDASVRRLPRR